MLPLGKERVHSAMGMLGNLAVAGGNVSLRNTGANFDPSTFNYRTLRVAKRYVRLSQPFDAKVQDELVEIFSTVNDTGYQQCPLEGGSILPFVK